MIVVYTAIVGGFGNVLRPPAGPVAPGVRFVCFTDCVQAVEPWEARPLQWRHPAPRRIARWHKLHPHVLFPGQATLWLDGNQQVLTDPQALADEYLAQHDLVTYKHPLRQDVYQELRECVRLGKDDPKVMAGQVDRYRREGLPAGGGLVETTVLLRKPTAACEVFDTCWWRELSRASLRDQLSFNYVAWQLSKRYGLLPGCRDRPVHFRYHAHR